MSTAGPGLSPNKQAATGKVPEQPPKKIFASGGLQNCKAPKAPELRPGQASKITGR